MLDVEIENAETIRKRMSEIRQREKEISNEDRIKIECIKNLSSKERERADLFMEKISLQKSCRHLNKNHEKSWKNKRYKLNVWFVCDDCGYED